VLGEGFDGDRHAASAIIIYTTRPAAEVRLPGIERELPSLPRIKSLSWKRVMPSRVAAASCDIPHEGTSSRPKAARLAPSCGRLRRAYLLDCLALGEEEKREVA